jgi:hypothetical protein
MKTKHKILVFVSFLVALFLACFVAEVPSDNGFVKTVAAFIGRPWTPLGFAGVARRTAFRAAAYRSAAATAAVADSAAAWAAANPAPQPLW